MHNVTVVIPTISEDVLTRRSIPDNINIIIARDGTLNEARNAGINEAETKKIMLMDDDVQFSEDFFWDIVDRIAPDKLVGMADWNYDLVAGRLMGFRKSTWAEVGGFDERLRSHMGDTDFAIACAKRGYEIERIPQSEIHHEGPPGAIERTGAWDHAWRGLYLAAKHPRYAPRLFRGMVRPILTGSD
jgi:glycosyltransferase involved in cell wall biosynthesis